MGRLAMGRESRGAIAALVRHIPCGQAVPQGHLWYATERDAANGLRAVRRQEVNAGVLMKV